MKILGNYRKFHENLDTCKVHNNWYIEFLSHAEHEYGLSFLIVIILNTISPCFLN